MYCYKCGKKNNSSSKFCHWCGCKLKSSVEGSIKEFLKYSNLKNIKNVNFFKKIAYNKFIISEKRHLNIFILTSILIISLALITSLIVGLSSSFTFAFEKVNSISHLNERLFVKPQVEQIFRDVWVRFILILSLLSVISFCAIFYFYIVKLKILNRKFLKNNVDFLEK